MMTLFWYGVGRVGRFCELGPAVGIQPLCVLVEGHGEPVGVAVYDRGHNLAVGARARGSAQPPTV